MFHVEQYGDSDSCFVEVLLAGAKTLGLALSDTTIEQCALYLRDLRVWNEKTNLTAITTDREIAVKHFLDSFACQKAINWSESVRLLDVGSGAGFPGLPLKLMYRDMDLTLLEPSQKKTAFLRHMIGILGLDRVIVISKRVEELSRERSYRQRFTHIITRAVKVTDILDDLIPLLSQNGTIILCRAEPLDAGFKIENLQIKQEIAYTLPMGYGSRVLSLLAAASR